MVNRAVTLSLHLTVITQLQFVPCKSLFLRRLIYWPGKFKSQNTCLSIALYVHKSSNELQPNVLKKNVDWIVFMLLLFSADLSMTGVWSSLMLETWPTHPKSSEVCRNIVTLVQCYKNYTETHTNSFFLKEGWPDNLRTALCDTKLWF